MSCYEDRKRNDPPALCGPNHVFYFVLETSEVSSTRSRLLFSLPLAAAFAANVIGKPSFPEYPSARYTTSHPHFLPPTSTTNGHVLPKQIDCNFQRVELPVQPLRCVRRCGASARRMCLAIFARARANRAFTVPCGTPNTWAVSRTERPSTMRS